MSDVLSRAQQLFELGAHLGHRKNRLHPRARAFVYQIVDGVSIIDLEKTIPQIDEAKKIIRQAGLDGKNLLVCATKKNISHSVAKLSFEKNINYITAKWLPGLFTNFDTIAKNVKKLKKLKEDKAMGEWQKFVKHEQVALEKETRKLERLYGGISSMDKLPDILFVVDIKREKNAVVEAKKIGIPVVAIVDTNCNPEDVDYPIVINDDTPDAVEAVVKEVLEGYEKKVVEQKPEPMQKPQDSMQEVSAPKAEAKKFSKPNFAKQQEQAPKTEVAKPKSATADKQAAKATEKAVSEKPATADKPKAKKVEAEVKEKPATADKQAAKATKSAPAKKTSAKK